MTSVSRAQFYNILICENSEKKWSAPQILISSLPCHKASLDQIWSKSIDPNSSYSDDKRSRAQFYNIFIRENSEKNDWPLKF